MGNNIKVYFSLVSFKFIYKFIISSCCRAETVRGRHNKTGLNFYIQKEIKSHLSKLSKNLNKTHLTTKAFLIHR